MLKITNVRNCRVLANKCRLADTMLSRAVGLLNRSSLERGEGLLIRPCNSVHCFFMRFPIDVLFMDAECRVLKMYTPMKPWRMSTIVRGSKQVIELPSGVVADTGTKVGDILLLEQS